MNGLVKIPLTAITALTSEPAVKLMRDVLRTECRYGRLSPSALTISSRITISDGGIDAEVNTSPHSVPPDCIFQAGLTGFQIKSGTSFKPWTTSSIKAELLNSKGQLFSEVEHLAKRRGRYALICTGHDLTPKQRNDSKMLIAGVLADQGYANYEDLIDVVAASQLADVAERYPSIASSLAPDPIQEALVIDEWQRDAYMSNPFTASDEQTKLIEHIRAELLGDRKHIRILGEPGLGKTRLVLEALRDPNLAPCVLYIPHGLLFGQTRLFRQLLKSTDDKPLILVVDELPESELAEIWRHLKNRCGALKLITLDHGRDETRDEEIERLQAPKLPKETIKKILASLVGESNELDRWVEICDGSPRVAQAVAENLRANPDDILKPPSTVPIWERYLHGYGKRDEQQFRQVDCVAMYLALFSRFGYESTVADEARYIAKLIETVDPTIGWARFQEIIQSLRARRVLQGSKTLFFVPRALHIYLWKRFWETYGRGFQFVETLSEIPSSLHAWFMSMFKFAEGSATAQVIDDILKTDGLFSNKDVLTSAKGSQFLSILAEASPLGVLKLLESTIGRWSDTEIAAFADHRQQIVWTLEKTAVWPHLTVRSLRLLARLAKNETATYSNNATGTLTGLFRIGCEAAATESSPAERLIAAIELLRSSSDLDRFLGLECMKTALNTSGLGGRMVGPEYQGLKERAKLWIPKAYEEWGVSYKIYFQAMIDETKAWPANLRTKVCSTLINAIENLLIVPACTELAFSTLESLARDPSANPSELNQLFFNWTRFHKEEKTKLITKRLAALQNRYVRKDMSSRFQRYVIDVDWMEWDGSARELPGKGANHTKTLVNALAKRVVEQDALGTVLSMLSPQGQAPALWYFGKQLSIHDPKRILLPPLQTNTLVSKHWGCLGGYLSHVREVKFAAFSELILKLLSNSETAWLGGVLTLRSSYDEKLFDECLKTLELGWLEPTEFSSLRFGMAWQDVPVARMGHLLNLLHRNGDKAALSTLMELLAAIRFDNQLQFQPDLVLDVLSRTLPNDDNHDVMRGYHWKQVGEKLIKWQPASANPVLDMLLTKMTEVYALSYDHYIEPFASSVVLVSPIDAWETIRKHLEQSLPKWASGILNWLKGGLGGFDEKEKRGAIANLPIPDILVWIEVDPASRAGLIAHATPGTLNDEHGGLLTRELLARYTHVDGVKSGISASFHSGGWMGPTSEHLKRRRDKLRLWLGAGFHIEVVKWVEEELESLDKSIEREQMKEEREDF